MTPTIDMPAKIRAMRDAGALFVCNHSAGKDSQAMLIYLRSVVPAWQLLVIHADLGEVEWPGNVDHIKRHLGNVAGLVIAEPVTGFFDMVERRGMFPDKKRRQCTSDLKRGPINREIRRYLKTRPEHGGQVVNCMGIRAGESRDRAKKPELIFSERNSKAGREWYDWHPILRLHTLEVFAMIADAWESHHYAYDEGMSRVSCCFCILGNPRDYTTAALLRPALYGRYTSTEDRFGFTLSPTRKTLEELTGLTAHQAATAAKPAPSLLELAALAA